jgi:hypothetical protein
LAIFYTSDYPSRAFRFKQDQIKVKLGEYDFKQEGETGDKTFTVSAMKMHEAVRNGD